MKCVIKHERLGEITYEESFWTGKKSLYLDGQILNSTAKNVFQTANGETITLTGNFFTGTKGSIGGETITFTQPFKWYEYVLSAIPFLLVLIWGNVVALCEIVPIIGGAIGGAIGGLFLALNLVVLRKLRKVYLKILVSVGMTGLCFLICYLIALAVLAAL